MIIENELCFQMHIYSMKVLYWQHLTKPLNE